MALGEWAVRWLLTEPEPSDVDPVTLTWWMHRRVDLDRLPDRRVVIEFDYTGRATPWSSGSCSTAASRRSA